MADSSHPTAWDSTWQVARDRFASLNSDAMRSMTRLVTSLESMAEIRGLFAVTHMTTLRISPYSCYPDWFNGRYVLVDANGVDDVKIRLAANGHDQSPQLIQCSFEDAPVTIAALCREHM